MPASSKADVTTNLLLSLAWLGELDKTQVQRLCLSNRSISTVEKTLTALRKDSLVEPRSWYISVDGIPHEQPSLWALTKKGHELIVGHDQYPPKPAPIGPKRLIGHDYRTNETIITLVEHARRSDLSGIYVQYEVRLDPTQPRPRMDALLIIQTGGGYARTDLVPWSKDPAIEDEARWRFAIESDSDTEPIAVIEGKARAYRAVHRDPTWHDWWRAQWGPLPFTIWVVPNPPRLYAVHEAWERTWPTGTWMLTTEKSLPLNKWLVYVNRESRGGRIEGFPHPRPKPQPVAQRALPAPAAPAIPATPAPPAAAESRPTHMAALEVVQPAQETAVSSAPPLPTPQAQPIRVMPMLPPPRPIGPPFERPDTWEPEGFPWTFTVKAGLSAFLVSVAITATLLYGMAGLTWARAWGATLLWVVAGCTLIGLVAWKHDTWWLGSPDVGRVVNRGTMLLGLTLLVLPTGFSRWSWAVFGPVPDNGPVLVADPAVPAPATLLALPPGPSSTPASSPTPGTCGLATVSAPRGLRLRASPATAGAIIETLRQHTQLELLCDTHDAGGIRWAHVRTGAGEGWVAEAEGDWRYLIRP
ncbi:MAG TPA: replication-relaxation family protein [Herpetosiphonaceae bacterium]|nr:replication-relaxation family protein [Herpetosiphonaceae bacterium]